MKQKFFILTALAFLFVGFMNIQKGYAADKDCGDFTSQKEAQAYFLTNGGSTTNNFDDLDRDHDGVACENHTGYTSKETNFDTTLPQATVDKDCGDFTSQKEAQAYFLTNGGSTTNNVDDLDRDHDGVACEDYTGYTSAETNYDTNNGGTLPNTATSYPYSIVIGLLILATSAILFIRTKPAR